MKRFISLAATVFAVCTGQFVSAQIPSWSWAQTGGGIGIDQGTCIATDPSGNVYVGGYYYSPTVVVGSATITNSGSGHDFYIAKYAPSGSIVWAKDYGFPGGDDYIYSIATDATGNLYITGLSRNDTLVLGSDTLVNAGTEVGVFTAKLNAAGDVSWARKSTLMPGTGSAFGVSISVDGSGNVITAGRYVSATVGFGGTTLTNPHPLYTDMFIVKYDSSGNVLWAKGYGGLGDDDLFGVAVDATGNIYFTGNYTSSSIMFGSFLLTDTNPGSPCFCLVKLDPSGVVTWAKNASVGSSGTTIALDPSGNIIVSGTFGMATVVIDGVTLTQTGTFGDVFIAKFDPSGTLAWAKRNGSTGAESITGIKVDNLGNAYICGGLKNSSAVFGDSTISSTTFANELFVAKYDGSGNAVWGISTNGGIYDDVASAIAIDATGENIYITGYSNNGVTKFGNVETASAAGANYDNVFVAKISTAPTGVQAINAANDIKLFPNPTSGTISVEGCSLTSVSVSDINGKLLLSSKANADIVNLDISSLPSGVYFLTVTDHNGQFLRKVKKQ